MAERREIIQTTEQLELFPREEWRKKLIPVTDVYAQPSHSMRTFDTGATRNVDEEKLNFEGFLSPVVIRRYAEYMHTHRKQADGNLRDADNWQKGIPKSAYMESGTRHHHEWWSMHRGYTPLEPTTIEDAICALLFNAQGYLHELLKERKYGK